MQEVTGVVTCVGAGVVSRSALVTGYSFIEIGDVVLKNVKASVGIGGMLDRAVNTNAPVTLYIERSILCAIKFPDGKLYGSDLAGIADSWFSFFLFLFMGIGLAAIVIGLVFLANAWFIWRNLMLKNEIQSMPGVIVI